MQSGINAIIVFFMEFCQAWMRWWFSSERSHAFSVWLGHNATTVSHLFALAQLRQVIIDVWLRSFLMFLSLVPSLYFLVQVFLPVLVYGLQFYKTFLLNIMIHSSPMCSWQTYIYIYIYICLKLCLCVPSPCWWLATVGKLFMEMRWT